MSSLVSGGLSGEPGGLEGDRGVGVLWGFRASGVFFAGSKVLQGIWKAPLPLNPWLVLLVFLDVFDVAEQEMKDNGIVDKIFCSWLETNKKFWLFRNLVRVHHLARKGRLLKRHGAVVFTIGSRCCLECSLCTCCEGPCVFCRRGGCSLARHLGCCSRCVRQSGLSSMLPRMLFKVLFFSRSSYAPPSAGSAKQKGRSVTRPSSPFPSAGLLQTAGLPWLQKQPRWLFVAEHGSGLGSRWELPAEVSWWKMYIVYIARVCPAMFECIFLWW